MFTGSWFDFMTFRPQIETFKTERSLLGKKNTKKHTMLENCRISQFSCFMKSKPSLFVQRDHHQLFSSFSVHFNAVYLRPVPY